MFPLRDDVPSRRLPAVVWALVFINAAIFLHEAGLAPGALQLFMERYALVPARLTMPGGLAQFWPTLITSMFLHGSWLHIIGNMWFLWIFGDNVEDRFGSVAYLVFYLLCGVVAAIGQGLLQPEPMVGASGAIAGVLGAYLVMFPVARVSTLVFLGIFITILQLPALIVIGFFIVLQFIDALAELRFTAHQATTNIAYFAHLFGFTAGVVLCLLFRRRAVANRSRFG